jgi:hypothetical protein
LQPKFDPSFGELGVTEKYTQVDTIGSNPGFEVNAIQASGEHKLFFVLARFSCEIFDEFVTHLTQFFLIISELLGLCQK